MTPTGSEAHQTFVTLQHLSDTQTDGGEHTWFVPKEYMVFSTLFQTLLGPDHSATVDDDAVIPMVGLSVPQVNQCVAMLEALFASQHVWCGGCDGATMNGENESELPPKRAHGSVAQRFHWCIAFMPLMATLPTQHAQVQHALGLLKVADYVDMKPAVDMLHGFLVHTVRCAGSINALVSLFVGDDTVASLSSREQAKVYETMLVSVIEPFGLDQDESH